MIIERYNIAELSSEVIGDEYNITLTLSNGKSFNFYEKEGKLRVGTDGQIKIDPRASNLIDLNYERY